MHAKRYRIGPYLYFYLTLLDLSAMESLLYFSTYEYFSQSESFLRALALVSKQIIKLPKTEDVYYIKVNENLLFQ